MVSRPHRGRFPFRFTDCRSYLEGAGRADSWVLNNLNGLPVDVGRLLAAWLLFDCGQIENVVTVEPRATQLDGHGFAPEALR